MITFMKYFVSEQLFVLNKEKVLVSNIKIKSKINIYSIHK